MEFVTKVYLSTEKLNESEVDDEILKIKDKMVKSFSKELIEQNVKYTIKEDKNGLEIDGLLTIE